MNKTDNAYDKTISVILTRLFDEEKKTLPEASERLKDAVTDKINEVENGLQ